MRICAFIIPVLCASTVALSCTGLVNIHIYTHIRAHTHKLLIQVDNHSFLKLGEPNWPIVYEAQLCWIGILQILFTSFNY